MNIKHNNADGFDGLKTNRLVFQHPSVPALTPDAAPDAAPKGPAPAPGGANPETTDKVVRDAGKAAGAGNCRQVR